MPGLRRMTPAMWRDVRREYANGTSAKELSERFPVARQTIYWRSCRERWRDLEAESSAGEPGK